MPIDIQGVPRGSVIGLRPAQPTAHRQLELAAEAAERLAAVEREEERRAA